MGGLFRRGEHRAPLRGIGVKRMAEEKREWLPASEWNDAVEKITAAQTQADHMDCDSRPREEQREPVEATDLNAYPKGMVESVAAYFSQERFQTWLKRATKPLRYPPDRRQVKKEFTEHFEERVEGLKDRGMPLSEARNKAVEMLGSPEETGELLRQVHKPWLGWVLRFFRLALIALVIVVAVKLIDGTDTLCFLTKNQVLQEFHVADGTYTYRGEKEVCTTVAARRWTGSDEVEFGAFTVRFEDVIYRYYRSDWITEDGKNMTACELSADVLLRFTGAPWDKLPQDFSQYVRIVDDNGTEYNTLFYDDSARSIRITDRRALPWAYVVCISFEHGDWPEDAKRLDVFLGRGETAQKMSVWLEDWQICDADALPVEDETNAAQWEKSLDNAWYAAYVKQEKLGSFAPTAEQKNGVELSIPLAALDVCEEKGAEPEEPDGDKPWTIFHGEIADCVLVVRGDMSLQPFSVAGMKERLRIVDPAQGADAPVIPYAISHIETCRNVTVWRVCWQLSPDAEACELQYWPTQEGPAGTLTVELKEEREP